MCVHPNHCLLLQFQFAQYTCSKIFLPLQKSNWCMFIVCNNLTCSWQLPQESHVRQGGSRMLKQLLRTTQFFTQTAQPSDSRHDKTESGLSFLLFFWNFKVSVSSLFDHTLYADGTSTHTFSLTFLYMNEAKTRVF